MSKSSMDYSIVWDVVINKIPDILNQIKNEIEKE